MITVTKKFSFCYGHFLPDYDGKCANQHGHNSEVEVEVAMLDATPRERNMPPRDGYPGMVMDFGDLKKIVAPLIDALDHRQLNDVLPPECLPPTAENIALWLVGEIDSALMEYDDIHYLVRLRVSETPTSWAEWRRGK